MKSALLEMKGVRACEDAAVAGLCTPLMALVRFNGYFLVAQSIVLLVLSSPSSSSSPSPPSRAS